MVSQNIFNLVDTAMVGRLGPTALAGVGLGSYVNFMAFAFVTGLAVAVQAMVARRKGEGRDDITAVPLNGGLVLALAAALPLSTILFLLAPTLIGWLNDDPGVVAEAGPYLQARVVAIAAVGMNFAYRGFWNATDRPGYYLRTQLIMHAVNIALNYMLIFGNWGAPAMGALGAGIGTAIATFVGTAMYTYLGVGHGRPNGFLVGWPDRDTMRRLIRFALPSALQQFLFAAGLTAMFWIIGLIGVRALAASNVMTNIMLVAVLPSLGLGLASATLVGQALGRGDIADARRWPWDTIWVGMALMLAIGLPLVLVPDLVVGVFVTDQETIAIARWPLRMIGCVTLVDLVAGVMMNSLNGAGATRQTMIVTVIMQWIVFLPTAWLVGPTLGYGLLGMWICYVVYRIAVACILSALWQAGYWSRIRL